MKKRVYIYAGCIMSVVTIGLALHTNTIKVPITRISRPIYAADFSDERILVGGSHNIFVGKIIHQVGNKHRKSGQETQFDVVVVSNIKGNLHGRVVVDQFGGYENGVLYTVDGGLPTPTSLDDQYLLQPGSTYLLATRYNPTENWYTLNSFATARKLISKDDKLSTAELKTLAENDERVKQLEAAYPNEIALQADISHGNAQNAYHSRRFDIKGDSIDDTVELAKKNGKIPADEVTIPAANESAPSATPEVSSCVFR